MQISFVWRWIRSPTGTYCRPWQTCWTLRSMGWSQKWRSCFIAPSCQESRFLPLPPPKMKKMGRSLRVTKLLWKSNRVRQQTCAASPSYTACHAAHPVFKNCKHISDAVLYIMHKARLQTQRYLVIIRIKPYNIISQVKV